MDKRFWAIIGVIVVVFGGIVVYQSHKDSSDASSNSTPTSHTEGKVDSNVTLVEYGDYQCPVCENYYATVKAVQEKYNDKVKFQFRNLPLSSAHPNAFAAARAAEAADMQGKFWEMHDLLYNTTNWQEWTPSDSAEKFFENYASQLGLNVSKFKQDFASAAVNSRINADIQAFKDTKQSMATPTFFINGKYVENGKLVDSSREPSVDAFSKQLDDALKNAQ